MSALDVRIVELPALRVASGLGFGTGPEGLAWEKIFSFLREKNLWDEMESLSYFGFNNPDPTPGSPNYGYEQWVVVPGAVQGTAEVTIKTFDGGLYAVTRNVGIPNIFNTWQNLFAWREDSPYGHGSHQWLEQWINPSREGIQEDQMVLDLYLPVTK